MTHALLAAAGLALALLSRAAAADGDPQRGAKLFNACRSCHLVGPGARHSIGPVLNDIVGRRVGAVAGYTYSRGMQELSAAVGVWTPELLDRYLADPKAYVPNGKMAFPGVPERADRADIIAYLRSLAR